MPSVIGRTAYGTCETFRNHNRKMKKFSILLAGALAMAAVSCDEAPEMPPMQANPQQPILESGDIAGQVEGVLVSTETFSLEDADATVPVFTVTKAEDLPAGATVTAVLELSGDASFGGKVEKLAMSEDNGVYSVVTDQWNAAHIKLFGKSPKVKTVYYRVPLYVSYDGTEYRYNGLNWYAASGTVNETCRDAGFVVYDHYYFLGDATTWELAQADVAPFVFSHSDADVYDDPVFTYTIKITQDEIDSKNGAIYWKIASQGAVDANSWDLVYGPEENGDENLVGTLVGDGAAQAGKIVNPGKYEFTINMEAMTYSIKLITLPDFIAVSSEANGWGQEGPRLYYTGKDDRPYFCGAARVNNVNEGFKFIWDNDWYGGTATSADGGTISAAQGNIVAPQDATQLYWFTVNTDAMTYTIAPVNVVGVVGGFNGWDAGAATPLTPSADLLTWSADIALSGEWKIVINGDWVMSYGGPDLGELTYDGGNISGYEGNYHMVMDFSGYRPSLTLTAL